MRIVGKLPIFHVKLQRFCPRAVVKSESWQGNKEETATARKVKSIPRQRSKFQSDLYRMAVPFSSPLKNTGFRFRVPCPRLPWA